MGIESWQTEPGRFCQDLLTDPQVGLDSRW